MFQHQANSDGEGKKLDETLRLLTPNQKAFDRYLLKRIIGRGGMGVVWLAWDERLDLDVALKFLPDAVSRDPEAIADLRRETRRSLALTHTNIVRVYDFFQAGERSAISMEYIDGESLSALKAQRPQSFFEVEEIAPWVQQLCAALHFAHAEARIVHQDLKPSNLMVTTRGQLKVADFGIARSISDSVTRITAEKSSGGTLLYMGPQQIDGERPSPLNDIYSLGATLYDLLAGKPPFYTGALYEQIARKTPTTIAERRTELGLQGKPIPAQWEETIAACLAKQPEQRPQSALKVAQRLGLPSARESVASSRPVAEVSSERRRSRLVWAAAAALATGGLLLAATLPHWLGRSQSSNPSGASAPAIPQPPAAQPQPDYYAVHRRLKLPSVFDGLSPQQSWENSLGMKFLPIGQVGFSVWETRVRDFEAFVNATHYDATQGVIVQGRDGFVGGVSWKQPNFPTSAIHPVSGVNWEDAMAFCRWLTEKERKEGRLHPQQSYRLPFSQEWEQAAGATRYPWGDAWPPPPGAGNFAGTEVREDGNWPAERGVIEGYNDGYARNSPVGTFRANANGLYDMAGNVWEWCQDIVAGNKRMLHGGSWHNYMPANLQISFRGAAPELSSRDLGYGFRCVLEEEVKP